MAVIVPMTDDLERRFGKRAGEDIVDYIERTQKELDQLYRASVDLPEGVVIGALVKFQVADGFAYYQVVRTHPQVQLVHIPYAESYRADPELIGRLRKADIAELVKNEKVWAEITSPRQRVARYPRRRKKK